MYGKKAMTPRELMVGDSIIGCIDESLYLASANIFVRNFQLGNGPGETSHRALIHRKIS